MNATPLIDRFLERYPNTALPPSFFSFLKEQERLGHVIRRAKDGQPLRQYLESLGAGEDVIGAWLDADSRIAFRPSFADLMTCAPSELNSYFAAHYTPVFRMQEIVLDSETLTGFNRHGIEHLQSVTRRVRKLLRLAQFPNGDRERAEREAIIAAHLHDIGNLLSRKDHGIYALYLLTQVFTEVDRDEATLDSMLHVLEAVLFHEVDFGSRVATLTELSPITLSLIVADKTDVSFRRVSDKSNVSEAIEDAHTLVNLLTAGSRIRCRKKDLRWEIHFSPTLGGNGDSTRFSALLKRSERVWVPDEWQKLYRRENIEYIFIFNATFLRLYLGRLSFAVRAVFALNPEIETFQLVIEDDERGVSLKRRFMRDDYEAKLSLISNNLFKNL